MAASDLDLEWYDDELFHDEDEVGDIGEVDDTDAPVPLPPASPSPRVSVPHAPPVKYSAARNKPRCRYCLSDAVYWEQENGKWRLFDRNLDIPHSCGGYQKVTAAKEQLERTSPSNRIRDPRWTIDFYEPDDVVAETKPFATRTALTMNACDAWLKYAKDIKAKVIVRHIMEVVITYDDES